MDNSKQATLELGTKPVGHLLMQYALPAIAAMTAASLYNMTDSIFIGQGCGPLAISGLAITFPLQNISQARTERLQHSRASIWQCRDLEHHHRHCVQRHYAFVSQPHTIILRSQRSHAALCP